MGWLVLALVDVLGVLPDDAATRPLRSRTRAILGALALRQAPSGLWPQVLDAPDLAGNYEESSASAMFAYAFLRAARQGLVQGDEAERFRRTGRAALDGLRPRLVGEAGSLRFPGICSVAGPGALAGPYRDGTPA